MRGSIGAGGGLEAAGGLPWSGLSQGAGWQEALGAERSVCRAEPEGVPLAEGPCPTNDVVLCLLHSCLGQELSDREIPLTTADQATFLSEVLRRTCHGPGELLPLSRTARSGPAPFPHPSGGLLSLGFGLPLSSPQSPASLPALPSSTHLYPHRRSGGVSRGGPRDPKGSSSQQRPGRWRLSASSPGQH